MAVETVPAICLNRMRVRFGYPLKRKRNDREYFHYLLTISGKRFAEKDGYGSIDAHYGKDTLWVYVFSQKLKQALERCQFSDLHGRPATWDFTLIEWDALRIDFRYAYPKPELAIFRPHADFNFDSDNWRYPWGIADYGRMCRDIASEVLPSGWRCEIDDDIVSNGVRVHFPHPRPSDNIGETIAAVRQKIALLNEHARLRLIATLNKDTIVRFFDFSPDQKASCVQYLVFFSEFLRALGIEAETSLTDEGRKLVFTIAPRDGKEVLPTVQAALNVYLHLPGGTIATTNTNSTDMRIRNLAMSIIHFQQLTGASANKLPDTIVDVLAEPQVDGAKESFFGGRFVIKKWEKGPFVIDLPKVIRDLKTRIPFLKRLT